MFAACAAATTHSEIRGDLRSEVHCCRRQVARLTPRSVVLWSQETLENWAWKWKTPHTEKKNEQASQDGWIGKKWKRGMTSHWTGSRKPLHWGPISRFPFSSLRPHPSANLSHFVCMRHLPGRDPRIPGSRRSEKERQCQNLSYCQFVWPKLEQLLQLHLELPLAGSGCSSPSSLEHGGHSNRFGTHLPATCNTKHATCCGNTAQNWFVAGWVLIASPRPLRLKKRRRTWTWSNCNSAAGKSGPLGCRGGVAHSSTHTHSWAAYSLPIMSTCANALKTRKF